jgi:hypothetical protein
MVKRCLSAALLCWLATACATTTVDSGICPYTTPVVSQPSGGLHGEPCTKDSECKYGTCVFEALQLGKIKGAQGVCTKQCACGGPTSACSSDDDAQTGRAFTCIAAGSGAGKECAMKCASAADCLAINSELKYCVAGVSGKFQTAVKVCTSVAP